MIEEERAYQQGRDDADKGFTNWRQLNLTATMPYMRAWYSGNIARRKEIAREQVGFFGKMIYKFNDRFGDSGKRTLLDNVLLLGVGIGALIIFVTIFLLAVQLTILTQGLTLIVPFVLILGYLLSMGLVMFANSYSDRT